MTGENRKENIKAELAKAKETLSEADLLNSGGFIYRSCFKALLFSAPHRQSAASFKGD